MDADELAKTINLVATRARALPKEAFFQLLFAANPKTLPTYDPLSDLATPSHQNALQKLMGVDKNFDTKISDQELYNYYIAKDDGTNDVCAANSMTAREQKKPVQGKKPGSQDKGLPQSQVNGQVLWTDCSSVLKMLVDKHGVEGVYCQPCSLVRGWKAGDPCPVRSDRTGLVINVGRGIRGQYIVWNVDSKF